MICIPIIAKNMDSALADIKKANNIADIVELRIDYISNFDLKKLIEASKKPVIITNRRKIDGGKFEGSEEERLAALKQAIDLGADYIDIEIDSDYNKVIRNKKNSKIIVSYHNFNETPNNINDVYNKLKSANADIIKIAATANKLSDNLKIIELIKNSEKPIIGLCMGPLGEISRILAPLYGSFLAFASLEKDKESAPGQIPAETLKTIYRINDIKPGFKVYGGIGNPINESKGHIIHNSMFKKNKLNSIYLNFQVDDLEEFIKNFSSSLSGFSVTMPHKQKIIEYLDKIDPIAEKIGAVNTAVNNNGKLTGYNTDITGAIKAIEVKTKIKNKNVTILGAGGAARAIAVGIIEKGGKLTVLNRTVEKAEKLSKEFNCNFGSLQDFEKIKTDILINTTSVGMHPNINETPVNTKNVKNIVVFDAIYNPEKTKLLQEAERNNCVIISGIEMFINQAAEQFKLWTGKEPDTDFMRNLIK
ncbi:MAG: shikimate dehydrogenase [Candidatus Woesearchaeota archaeon]